MFISIVRGSKAFAAEQEIRKIKNIFLKTARFWTKISISPAEVSGKGVLKICSQFTEEHPCQSVRSHFGMGFLL